MNPNLHSGNTSSESRDFRRPLSLSIHSLPGPENITRVQLPNGVTVLSRSNFNSPSVVISGYLMVGALFDPDEKLGLADFTASALMRGTQARDFQQIYGCIGIGGRDLGFSSGTHTTTFSGKALAEDLDMLLELLTDAIRYPIFPLHQVQRLRAQLLTGLAIRTQDTAEMASLSFDELVYAGHPYSRPEDGYPATVQAIEQVDLVEMHQRYYGPRNAVIAVAGAVGASQAIEKVAHALGDWKNPQQPEPPALPPLTPLQKTVTKHVSIPGKSQSDLVIGAAGPSRRSPDYMSASLGNSVLGQFGMMGRIGDIVREQAGLAYYASSSLGGGSGPGPWEVSAGVDPANIDKVIELVRQEIARFVNEPVSEEELADSQANFIGRLPLSLESNHGVASALINLERYELGLDYYQRYPELIQSITPQKVLETAQTYLDPERLAVAVAG